MSLTDAQIAQIAKNIYILRDPANAKLPKPVTTTGAASLASKLDPVGKDTRFSDTGLGVIDFTADPMHPPVWLHNENVPWRIGSTSKMAMMLAAVQLRLEVRDIMGLKIISTPQEFDDLYALNKLWKGSKVLHAEQIPNNPPRISTIFDLSKNPINFTGPDPDKPDKDGIVGRVPKDLELSWEIVSNFSFSERYWLAGVLSDNVSATACISEIGVPYMKAVMRAYGFFDDDATKGMRFLLSEGFSSYDLKRHPISVNSGPRASAKFDPRTDYRPLSDPEKNDVKDPNKFFGLRSNQSGSAAALASFMLALMTNSLGNSVVDADANSKACNTIRNNMADGVFWAGVESKIGIGIREITTVTRQVDKIGILTKAEGERGVLDCEFIYVETKESSGKEMKYAIIATSVTNNTNGDLGKAIHKALLT